MSNSLALMFGTVPGYKPPQKDTKPVNHHPAKNDAAMQEEANELRARWLASKNKTGPKVKLHDLAKEYKISYHLASDIIHSRKWVNGYE